MSDLALRAEAVTVLPRRELMALLNLSFGSITVKPEIKVAAGTSVANAVQVLTKDSINSAWASVNIRQ